MKTARMKHAPLLSCLVVVGSGCRVGGAGTGERSGCTHRRSTNRRRTGLPRHLRQSLSAGRRSRRRTRCGGTRCGSAGSGRSAGTRRRRARRRGRWRRRTGSTGPGWLVRLALQSVRQPLLARYPSAFVVGAAHKRRHHHHRHQLRVGDAAGDHRRPDDAGPQSARHQIRHHQPRARRSRSGRGGAPEPLRCQGGDGRARLGVHAAAAGYGCRRSTEARHRGRT